MNDKQENTQSMHYAVLKINGQNQSAVSSVNALAETNLSLIAKVAEIDLIKEVQEMVSKGYTEDKAFKMLDMINAALLVIGPSTAYARFKNNLPLLENINYSKSNLLNSRDQDAYTKCQRVYDATEPIISDLADYGIKIDQLTDLQTKINAFKDAVQNPRAAISNRKSATEQLKTLFADAKKLLLIMDGLVKQFKTKDVNYYNAYFAAREIIDLGVRHKEPPTPPPPHP